MPENIPKAFKQKKFSGILISTLQINNDEWLIASLQNFTYFCYRYKQGNPNIFKVPMKLWNWTQKILAWILIFPIQLYRYFLSPWLPNSCRHIPTCSVYAIVAIKIHGPFIGLWLALRRILRCHPWGTHGYDPVPEKKTNNIN